MMSSQPVGMMNQPGMGQMSQPMGMNQPIVSTQTPMGNMNQPMTNMGQQPMNNPNMVLYCLIYSSDNMEYCGFIINQGISIFMEFMDKGEPNGLYADLSKSM